MFQISGATDGSSSSSSRRWTTLSYAGDEPPFAAVLNDFAHNNNKSRHARARAINTNRAEVRKHPPGTTPPPPPAFLHDLVYVCVCACVSAVRARASSNLERTHARARFVLVSFVRPSPSIVALSVAEAGER